MTTIRVDDTVVDDLIPDEEGQVVAINHNTGMATIKWASGWRSERHIDRLLFIRGPLVSARSKLHGQRNLRKGQ